MKAVFVRGERSLGRLAGSVVLGLIMCWAALVPAEALAMPALGCAEREAQSVVHATAVGLGALLQGQSDAQAGVELIRKFVAPIRFYPDNSGYFYVYDTNCVNIAHATQPDLQGKNLFDHQDTKGKYVIRALAEAAKKGGGFVDFYWVKPGDKGEHKKIGYVEPIPGTNYFIGSGVYPGK